MSNYTINTGTNVLNTKYHPQLQQVTQKHEYTYSI